MPKAVVHYIDSIYYDLELTSIAMKAFGNQLFEHFGVELSPIEHAALDTISCHEGICQRDLAKLLLKDRANTGRICDSLEEKGFITRSIDLKQNRLVKKMCVTEVGLKKLHEVHNKIVDYLQEVRAPICDEEIELLQNSLKKFRECLLEVVNMQI